MGRIGEWAGDLSGDASCIFVLLLSNLLILVLARLSFISYNTPPHLPTSGYEVRIVGGAVRDLLRGVRPKDVDMATNATPDQIVEVCKGAEIKHILTGSTRRHTDRHTN